MYKEQKKIGMVILGIPERIYVALKKHYIRKYKSNKN